MAEDTNVVTLVGRLGQDPELRHANSGTPIATFSLAVNHRKRGNEEPVSWFDVTAFGAQAETIAEYLTKGRQVAVQGYLEQQRWEKDGQKRSKVVVIANRIQFLASPGGGNGNGGGGRTADDLAGAGVTPTPVSSDDPEIPF
jgi:single-strand DNA-binding protein